MSLINQSIPNLFNGISQQSPSIRQAAQAELQENAFSSIVDGLHKRHPTNHLAKLTVTLGAGSPFIHTINRDSSEKYVMTLSGGVIKVWDLNGNAKTVIDDAADGYLTSSNPLEDFRAITIADTTFIVNTKKIAAMKAGTNSTYSSTVSYSAFNKLPATGTAGVLYKITGDSDNGWAHHFCKWTGSVYEECTGTSGNNQFDADTMPHKLVRNADGTFTFSRIAWNPRLVGDDTTNSPPSFIGSTIMGVFFFRNRLGFIADENVIFSRSGDVFNFWVETATQVLDTDPIDVSVSHIKVSNLKHAIPFNKNLLLFSELTQFTLTADGVLTPKTVAIHPTTEFECSKKAYPAVIGANVYFVVDKGGYSAVREYYVSPYTNTYDADDVTAHVPKYVPGNVTKLVSSSNDDIVVALSSSEPGSLYVYKFYWKGEEKLQSAWSKWIFKTGCSVLNIDTMGTKLYMVIQKSDGLYLEYIDLQVALTEDDLPFLVFLDRKVKLTGTYNAGTNKTTWTLPYQEDNVQVVLGGSFTGKKGALVTTSQPSNTTVEATGDYSSGAVYIGIPYTMKYTFSPQYVKDAKGMSISGAKLKLRNWRVNYTKTGFFRVEVTPDSRGVQQYTFVHTFTGKLLGVGSLLLGQASISTGTYQFPVMTDGTTGKISLVNDSYLPSFFQNAEWDGFYVNRAQRV